MKIALTILVFFGLAMLLSWPWIVGPHPLHPTRIALARYTMRFGIYIITLLIVFFTTALLASLVARKARMEFREEARTNMKMLIESTLEGHRKKSDDA